MKIRLGDFYPRLESGWRKEPGPRCHKLGGRVIQIQGGIGLAGAGARSLNAMDVVAGLKHIEDAAADLRRGFPEGKVYADPLFSRARLLVKLALPYRDAPTRLPKNIGKMIEGQLQEMHEYEVNLEGKSIETCGGRTGYMYAYQRGQKLAPLPKVHPDFIRQSDKQLEANVKAADRRRKKIQSYMKRNFKGWKK